ncbi:MAG: dihydroorotase [Syntrophales bacterium]|jgi:dihydroorotase|nr:dihydroorotase [Syntrophales bacterium]MDY0043935.1 dihydroorotase [Syntrophales bacterium]
MRLLLKGGRVIDPSQNIDDILDILIVNGKISLIDNKIDISEVKTRGSIDSVDIGGRILVPGLIDMHTHLREPGFEYKETIESGTKAAVAGGFTAIACMANTSPVNDNRSVTEFILTQAARTGRARVYPIAALTRNQEGKILTEFADLKDAGATGFSDDGMPVTDSGIMRCALEYAYSLDMPVISHCEDLGLARGGMMNEGLVCAELGLTASPDIAEEIMVLRDIILARYTHTRVHIAHVSTAGSVEAIRAAKASGIAVTAETAPHYFTLSEEALRSFSTNLKVYPPLRSERDLEAIKEGLADGTIDAIASDHAPHSSIEKEVEFDYAATGLIGLETSLSLSLRLVEEGILSMSGLIKKMSTNPADILGVSGGSLRHGLPADITVIDPEVTWTVDAARFHSKSRNCPYQGMQLRGRSVMTMVGGEIKYRSGL